MSGHTQESGNLSEKPPELAQGPEEKSGRSVKQPKPPLGPPHDTIAVLAFTIASAALFYSFGLSVTTDDPSGWIRFGLPLGAAGLFLATGHYLSRSYGFASRSWGQAPIGSRIAVVFAYVFIIQFVAPPVYEAYAQESTLVLVLACFAIPGLVVGALRGAWGKAPGPDLGRV